MSTIAYKGHEIITDPREIVAALQDEPEIAIDLETSGLRPHQDKIAVVSLYGEQTSALGVIHTRGKMPIELRPLLADKTKRFTYHNGVCFDIPFLLNNGIAATLPRLFDTLVGAGVAITSDRAGQSKSLQAEINRRLGVYIPKETTRQEARDAAEGKKKKARKQKGAEHHGSWMDAELTEQQYKYCADDVLNIHALRRAQIEQTEKQGQRRALDLEMCILSSVAKMTHNGLPLHLDSLFAYQERQRKIADLEGRILDSSFDGEHMNVNSPVQVKHMMRELGMNIPTITKYIRDPITGKRRKVVKETTQADVLEAIAKRGVPGLVISGLLPRFPDESSADYTKRAAFTAETMGRIVTLREVLKSVGFYDGYWIERFCDARNRVHAKFRQAGTATLRFAATEPNLQQWPKAMRHVIGGEEGMQIVASDYKQIEVVIAAELAEDHTLLALIATGGDIHRLVAARCLKKNESAVTSDERRVFKSANFCLIFGGTPETFRDYALANGSDITLRESEDICEAYFAEFAGLRKMKERAQELAWDKSRQIVEIRLRSGGVRHLIRREGSLKSTTILNTQVQGNAAAGMKHAIRECKEAGLDLYLGATIHDELVAVVPTRYAKEYGEELQRCMIRGMAKVLVTPARTDVSIGTFWS